MAAPQGAHTGQITHEVDIPRVWGIIPQDLISF
jgi:hypothetical protein